jgi:uncharacterized protein YbjT (DUF2867 family)
MITVLGASGNTGRRVATGLRAADVAVRAVGRDAGRLAEAVAAGAEAAVVDLADTDALTAALTGADAAYVLLPFDVTAPGYAAQQELLGSSIAAALSAARVPHVVALSSLGAELATGTGFLTTLHDQEQRLGALRDRGTDVQFLRPGLFFESFLPALPAMRAMGVHHDSIDPGVALPMVATADVAAAAVEELLAGPRSGVRELLGPEDLTLPEAVARFGPAVGLPGLRYEQLPDDMLRGILVDAGLPADVAERHLGMNAAFSRGVVHSLAGRSPATSTPTRIEDFAASLAPA